MRITEYEVTATGVRRAYGERSRLTTERLKEAILLALENEMLTDVEIEIKVVESGTAN